MNTIHQLYRQSLYLRTFPGGWMDIELRWESGIWAQLCVAGLELIKWRLECFNLKLLSLHREKSHSGHCHDFECLSTSLCSVCLQLHCPLTFVSKLSFDLCVAIGSVWLSIIYHNHPFTIYLCGRTVIANLVCWHDFLSVKLTTFISATLSCIVTMATFCSVYLLLVVVSFVRWKKVTRWHSLWRWYIGGFPLYVVWWCQSSIDFVSMTLSGIWWRYCFDRWFLSRRKGM